MHLQQQSSSASAYSCVGSNTNTSTSDHERTYAASAFPLSSYSSSTHTFTSGSSGIKAMFTASQWQELERQKMILKYMMASVPVPPQLLSSLHTAPSPPHVSQSSNILGLNLDLRFSSSSSSGSDPEPWRCKRTDGKKWRCSRDVAPDQKYCERHAHKNRSRSRKHVEVQTSSPNNSSSSPNSTTYSSRHQQQAIIFPFSNDTSNANTTTGYPYPTMASSARSYDQTRCIEWFTKGDSKSSNSRKSNPDSARNNKQQRQRLIKTASSSSTIITDNPNKKVPPLLYHHHGQPQYDDNDKDLPLGFMSLMNSYSSIPDHRTSHLHQISLGTHDSITRHFIDAWENEGKKFDQSSSSLSLSVSSGGNGITNDQDSDLNIGMVNSDRDSDGISRTSQQWLSNPAVSWMNINYSQPPPGGPLGEALCLGNSNSHVTRCDNNTNSSSCSKSSCEDGSHGLHFTG